MSPYTSVKVFTTTSIGFIHPFIQLIFTVCAYYVFPDMLGNGDLVFSGYRVSVSTTAVNFEKELRTWIQAELTQAFGKDGWPPTFQ